MYYIYFTVLLYDGKRKEDFVFISVIYLLIKIIMF